MKRTAIWLGGIVILLWMVVPMMSYAAQFFLVRGLVTDANENPIDGLDVTVANATRPDLSKTVRTGEESGSGIYSVVFFRLGKTVAESGDEIHITVEQEGEVLAEVTYILTDDDIEASGAVIDIPIESIVPAPILERVASEDGIITGGDVVQLIGENFQEGTSVTVGGHKILNVDFVSPTELTITIPEDAVGAVEIVVTNPDGQSTTIDVQIEPRPPAPILERVASEDGIITGGDVVQLIGENFQEGTSVTVGGHKILNVDFVSPTELTITIPEDAVGAVEIVVTNPDGQSTTIDVQIEPRPPAPILERVASEDGIITGGKTAQLIGENFQEGASVTVGGNEILNVDFVSPTELTITIPEDAVGAVEIVVTNPDGQSTTIDVQIEPRPPAPILERVASEDGIITVGKTAQLIGENFQEGASVTVGGNEILNVDFVSPTELTITIPEDAVGAVEIVVTNPDGQSTTIDVQIEPRPPAPILERVASEDGIITVGKTAQLIGENFQEGASVTVGGNEILNVGFVSPTELTITIPQGTVGVVEIVITNPDGQSATIEFAYVELLPEDINRDGVIDIIDLVQVGRMFTQTGEGLAADVDGNDAVDIFDLVRVARRFNQSSIVAAAPSAHIASQKFNYSAAHQSIQQTGTHGRTTAMDSDVIRRLRSALAELERISDVMPEVRLGADLLRNWLAANAGIPTKTQLLPNYPNPFNPETWIPYHLSHDTDATLSIYDAKGALVRQFDLGHRSAGFYTDKGHAVYWDGDNERGESVASGTYFYQLRAGDYTALRRMVILK